MGYPVEFAGSNRVLTAPEGREAEVQPMAVFTNGRNCVSCWQLTAEELAEIKRTGCVYLSVWSGGTQPPVYLGSEKSVHMVTDKNGGAWER